jgi:GNAT superfamily N-acetyltransferase
MINDFRIRQASEADIPLILAFIRQLADYERLSHAVVVTEDNLRECLFGERRYAEVLIGEADGTPVAFAIFFHNFSTFRGRPGLYLEDLFVIPEMRGKGFGRAMLVELARIARERNCGRLEWAVLDWNESAIQFYKTLGAVLLDDWSIFRVTDEALDRLATTAVKTC